MSCRNRAVLTIDIIGVIPLPAARRTKSTSQFSGPNMPDGFNALSRIPRTALSCNQCDATPSWIRFTVTVGYGSRTGELEKE